MWREDAITSRTGLTYKSAGVDIEAGNALVEAIKPLAKATARPGANAALGGFGAFFDLKAAGFKDPLLVATNDGVGTKVKLAIEAGKHDTIGIDLVAMCVNDLVVQGAEPLLFLDYYASAKLDVAVARDVVAGIAGACRESNCALVGGETAEMPGIYVPGDYDLAGFAVGAVERSQVLSGESVVEGDVLLGLASTGLHSNGFSLVRRIVAESGQKLSDPAPFAPDLSLGAALLTPTRLYVASCLAAHRAGALKALAHVTGGGLIENLPRVLPPGLGADIDIGAWPRPAVFGWLARSGGVPADDMARTFNCGIGMAAVCSLDMEHTAVKILSENGETVYRIGRIVARPVGQPRVAIQGLAALGAE